MEDFITAVVKLQHAADEARSQCTEDMIEAISVQHAAGRISATDVVSSVSTPRYDTSAMDGFAIKSSLTKCASTAKPVTFYVVGTVLPGDEPPVTQLSTKNGLEPCLKIMTGGRFPPPGSALSQLDACVKVEDVVVRDDYPIKDWEAKTIMVTKPVPRAANRREAGNDIQPKDVLVIACQRILSSHIMPLIAAGIRTITVLRSPRVGIWSTGREFIGDGPNVDINAPYLEAALQQTGCKVTFLGYLDDQTEAQREAFEHNAQSRSYDFLVSSGGVSKGICDCVPAALDVCGASVLFHGLNIRPGHPVLFAQIPSGSGFVPFFGLPGNVGAVAACFRFLIMPFLRRFRGEPTEEPIPARATLECKEQTRISKNKVIVPSHEQERFLLGRLEVVHGGYDMVQISGRVNSARLQPFICANCWVHVPSLHEVRENDIVRCYSMLMD